MKTVILGLGNELLGDDGVGIVAARLLKEEIRDEVKVLESSLSGLALLDILVGYEKAILIDSILTESGIPGQVYEIDPQDLPPAKASSGHYAGLPELFEISEIYQLDFPQCVKIFAVEVEDPYTLKEGLSENVQDALPDLIARVKAESFR